MNIKTLSILFLSLFILSCTKNTIEIGFAEKNLKLVNRELIFINTKSLELNHKAGVGLAILKKIDFNKGAIDVELKGEDAPGRSFVGIAFNIQNDSTYEAVYFRPFNFQSEDKIRREHAIQYISHPKNTWKFLRTNFKGIYEAEFPRKPVPTEWFKIRIEIEDSSIQIIDLKTNTKLLSVERLENQKSDVIGLWTGNNSKGSFKNLMIQK